MLITRHRSRRNSLEPCFSYASFILRRCRQLIPKTSAASIQLIVFAYALNIIWFLFVARSIAAPCKISLQFVFCSDLLPFAAKSGHIICYLYRTYNVLATTKKDFC